MFRSLRLKETVSALEDARYTLKVLYNPSVSSIKSLLIQDCDISNVLRGQDYTNSNPKRYVVSLSACPRAHARVVGDMQP